MSEVSRLVLVDPQSLFRHCLGTLLNRRRHLQVVGEAGTRAEALNQLRTQNPDIVLVEPDLPDGGPGLVGDLSQELPTGAIFVLTANQEDRTARPALQAGARGYLRKDCNLDDLVVGIQRVRSGELVLASGLVDASVRGLPDSATPPASLPGLTPREREVACLVAQGRTNADIARALFITEQTVKGHLAKSLAKLGLANRVQLATYTIQHGYAA